MFRVICVIIGYFVGCIQTAYLVGKISKNIDIRQLGSGNAGTTNVMRVLGKKAALITFIGDVLKAIIIYLICQLIWNGNGTFFNLNVNGLLPGLYGGLGVILGHNWPAFLSFKGGKGIASTIGIILCLDIKIALICYIAGLIVILTTKYVSLTSLTIALLLPITMLIFNMPMETIIIGIIITILAIYRHKSNIQRLIAGTENKIK